MCVFWKSLSLTYVAGLRGSICLRFVVDVVVGIGFVVVVCLFCK